MIKSFEMNKLNVNGIAINIIGHHSEIIKNILISKNRSNNHILINTEHNENIKNILDIQQQIILNNRNNTINIENKMIVLDNMNDSNYNEIYFKELSFNSRHYKID